MSEPTHAERVAAAVPDHCKIVALLHDAVEDGHVSAEAACEALAFEHAEALMLLTHDREQTYAQYILDLQCAGADEGAARIARTVKIADLRDNLYGRPEGPPPQSLRKRYEKALQQLSVVQVDL